MNKQQARDIDRAHQALFTRLGDSRIDNDATLYDALSFGRLLSNALIEEGYHTEMIVPAPSLHAEPELIVAWPIIGVSTGYWVDGVAVRLLYSSLSTTVFGIIPYYAIGAQYHKKGLVWWHRVYNVQALLDTLPTIVSLLYVQIQCSNCHYGNITANYCGRGLEGTGSCNHYKEKAIE